MFSKMWKEEWNIQKFKLEHDTPEDFTRSFWQNSQKVLPVWVAYRVIFLIYFMITFFYMFLVTNMKGDVEKIYIYATNWAYTIETLTFVLACIIVVERYIKEIKNPEIGKMEKMPWHYKCYWIIFTIVAPSAIVISFVFWLFLYDPDRFPDQLRSLILHAGNCLLVVVDFFLSGHPIRILHFYLPVVFALIYGLFTAIYQTSGGTGLRGEIPIYKILDWRHPDTAIETCIGVIIAIVIAHCLLSLLHLLKVWLKKPSDIL